MSKILPCKNKLTEVKNYNTEKTIFMEEDFIVVCSLFGATKDNFGYENSFLLLMFLDGPKVPALYLVTDSPIQSLTDSLRQKIRNLDARILILKFLVPGIIIK